MYLQQELVPSSSVDAAIQGNIVTKDRLNLCVARGNYLTIYDIVRFEGHADGVEMRVLYEQRLNGDVKSMERLSAMNNSGLDYLLLSFADAKLSVIQYSEQEARFLTVSMHCFEVDKFRLTREMDTSFSFTPEIKIDPGNRCAVLRFYRDNFAILPVKDELDGGAPFTSSYVMRSQDFGLNAKNIIDFAFLDGYFEPTIVILYETCPTTTSRLSVNKDSVSLLVVSLAVGQKSFSLINSLSGLSYDLNTIVSLKKSFGGFILFGINCVTYVDTSYRTVNMALNAYAQQTTKTDFQKTFSQICHLNGLVTCLISDNIVLCTTPDQYFFLEIKRSGRQIDLEMSVIDNVEITHCFCLAKIDRYVFCGAHGGDSLLYSLPDSFSTHAEAGSQKKLRIEMPDELDLIFAQDNSAESVSLEAVKQIGDGVRNLSVAVRLKAIGMLRDAVFAQSTYTYENYSNLQSDRQISVDLVGCSGYKSQCSLWAIHKTVKPYIRNTFELPDKTINSWTVVCSGSDTEDAHHKFLFITKESKYKKVKSGLYTMVFLAGERILELKSSDFYSGPTVFAGSLFENQRVIQVFPEGIFLLDEQAKRTQDLKLKDIDPKSKEGTTWIVHAAIVCDYVSILLNDSRLLFLRGISEKKEVEVMEHETNALHISLFVDRYGLLLAEKHTNTRKRTFDEDNSDRSFVVTPSYTEKSQQPMCAIVDITGHLKIFSLPDFQEVFLAGSSFTLLAPIIFCEKEKPKASNVNQNLSQVSDFEISSFGSASLASLCMTLVTQEGLVFIYAAEKNNNGVVLFRKLNAFHMCGNIETPTATHDEEEEVSKFVDRRPKQRKIMKFECLKGLFSSFDQSPLSGVFVTGTSPCFVFLNQRKEPRVHPMTIEGPIASWAPFHNINCSLGFIYFTQTEHLRIAQFDRRLDYQFHVPLFRAKLREISSFQEDSRSKEMTVQNIKYHLQSKKLCTIGFVSKSFASIKIADPAVIIQAQQDGDDSAVAMYEKENEKPVTLDPGKYFPENRRFYLDLVSPKTWELVDRVEFDDNENITAMQHILLDVKVGGSFVKRPYIALATAFAKGEDDQCRGKVYLYEIIEVVPKPGRPETNHKLKLAKQEEMKGTASCVSDLNGYLCVAIGPKIMLYSFEDMETLVGIAFFDTNLYITSLQSFKSFLVVGDIQKSVWFSAFQEDPVAKMVLLGKDYSQLRISDVNMIVEEENVGFAASDHEGNIVIFSYSPDELPSFSGHKLIKRADCNVGSMVSRFNRLSHNNNQILFYSCVNGAIGYLASIPEKTYKRLHDMSFEMTNQADSVAGLNPRSHRIYRSTANPDQAPVRNVINGDFIFKLLNEPLNNISKWSRNRGTSQNNVIKDLELSASNALL